MKTIEVLSHTTTPKRVTNFKVRELVEKVHQVPASKLLKTQEGESAYVKYKNEYQQEKQRPLDKEKHFKLCSKSKNDIVKCKGNPTRRRGPTRRRATTKKTTSMQTSPMKNGSSRRSVNSIRSAASSAFESAQGSQSSIASSSAKSRSPLPKRNTRKSTPAVHRRSARLMGQSKTRSGRSYGK